MSQNSATRAVSPEGGVDLLLPLSRAVPIFFMARHIPRRNQPQHQAPLWPRDHQQMPASLCPPVNKPCFPTTARDQSMGVFEGFLYLLDRHPVLGGDLVDHLLCPNQLRTDRLGHALSSGRTIPSFRRQVKFAYQALALLQGHLLRAWMASCQGARIVSPPMMVSTANLAPICSRDRPLTQVLFPGEAIPGVKTVCRARRGGTRSNNVI